MPSHASKPSGTIVPSLAAALLPVLFATAPAKAQTRPELEMTRPASAMNFHVKPQRLADALAAFGTQSGVRLAYPASLAEGINSPGFTGVAAPRAALRQLLRGTRLAGQWVDDTTVTLVRASADDAALQLPVLVASGGVNNWQDQDIASSRASSATKTDAALIDTPQAVSVVTRRQMELQNVQSVPQALRYTSGVIAEQNGRNENAYETIYGRGFILDEYLDGLRLPSISASSSYNIPAIDPYLLERIEVLHGPSSMLYGQTSPGGLVNLMTKHPTKNPVHDMTLSTGSYGRAQGKFDLGGPLSTDGTWSYRLTGDAYSAGTQVNHDRNSRLVIAPAITWQPDADNRLTLLLSYTDEPDAGLYGFLPAAGTVSSTPLGKINTKLDVGDPGYDRHNRKTLSAGYEFEHRFNDVWSVQQNLRFTHIDSALDQIFGLSLDSDNRTLNRYAFYNHGSLDQLTLDNRVSIKFNTGAVHHSLLAGIDYQHIAFDYRYGFSFAVPTLDVYAPVYAGGISAPSALTHERLNQNQLGLYVQDQLHYGHWSLIMGARGDYYDANDDVIGTSVVRQTQRAATWRAALLHHFDFGLAPYLSYSTSFQPNTSLSFGGGILGPTTGQQYEFGLKYQPPSRRSFVSAALFHLTQQNVATTDPAHPTFSISTGEIRSEGLELEARVALRQNWDAIVSYTYVDAINTRSNDFLNKSPTGIPRQQGAIWSNYTFHDTILAGFTLGGGVRMIGSSYGSQDNSLKVPGTALFDAMASYDLDHVSGRLQGWLLQVNASNLFDRDYVTQCTSVTQCTYGLRRLVLANLSYRW